MEDTEGKKSQVVCWSPSHPIQIPPLITRDEGQSANEYVILHYFYTPLYPSS
jgi:hypothetical protein